MSPANDPRVQPGSNDEVARLLALLVRNQLGSQTEAIIELARVGLGPKRISELLGTTGNTVSVTLQKAKAKEREAQPGRAGPREKKSEGAS